MKQVMLLSPSELTAYRNLLVKYAEKSLSQFVFAFRKLSKQEVTTYV